MRKLIALVGLAVLGVGGYYVVQRYSKSIPEKLERNAAEALRKANIVGITVEMDGLDATLSGAVPTAAQRDAAVAAVNHVAGVRNVDGKEVAVQPPDRGPGEPGSAEVVVELDATWAEGKLDVRGQVLGPVLAQRIAQKIDQAFEGAKVTNNVRKRDGAAPKEEEVVKRVVASLEALGRTSRGTLRVTDTGVTLNGTVADDETRERMTALLKSQVAPSVELAISVVVSPPVIDPIDAGPTEQDVAAASLGDGDEADAAGSDEDVDEAPDGEAAPDGDEPDVEEADTELADTELADTESTPDTVAPEPDTTEPEDTAPAVDTAVVAAEDVASEDTGRPIPFGVNLAATTPLTAEQCEEIAWWLVEGEKRIQFDRKRKLEPESDARVVQIAKLLERCPDTKVEVQGHTTAYGEPDALRAKAYRWAFTVRKRLTELGIPKERMTIRSYGYNRSRYPDTRETRHLNDRVEIKVKGVK